MTGLIVSAAVSIGDAERGPNRRRVSAILNRVENLLLRPRVKDARRSPILPVYHGQNTKAKQMVLIKVIAFPWNGKDRIPQDVWETEVHK